MARITLRNDKDVSATYVSNQFIDHYMTAANGEYVKIYLYLLRCMGSSDASFSLSAAADKFEHTEKDIQRALKYWEKMHLLQLEYDGDKKLSGIRFLDSGQHPSGHTSSSPEHPQEEASFVSASPQAQGKEQKAPPMQPSSARPSYTSAQMAAFREKENISELLFVTEHYLKRPLTSTDIQTIFFWYDELKLSVEIIEYLIEYCVGKGHTSLRYMDKVAIAWQEEGIRTIEQAKRASSAYGKLHFSVMKALGISGRNLVASEIACIDKWDKTYGFTPDIITEACRRTISATHQPSFEYADGILRKWYEQGVHHLNDIIKLDSEYQKSKTAASLSNKAASANRFHNFQQRTYDYDKLEQQLLNNRNP